MMAKDEIAAFWKLGSSLMSAPKAAKDSPEFMQAHQALYEQLKAKMLEEIKSQREMVCQTQAMSRLRVP